MNGEQDLFGNDTAKAHARRTHPDTSHLAAEEVTPLLRPLQVAVLASAYQRGSAGFIDPDMAEHFGSVSSTYRTRRSELVAMGLVEDSGERVTVGKGSSYARWRITGKGCAEYVRRLTAPLDQAA